MAWKSIVPGTELSDVKADRKNAVSIEKYKVSPNAIYLSGEYLPTSVITDMKKQASTYTPNCACGKGIPVFKIRVNYGAEKPLILMLEKEANADKLLGIISNQSSS